MIQATVVADTVHPDTGTRVTSLLVDFPRILLAEVDTHRAFSRSFASSRAIPTRRVIEIVDADPFVPTHFSLRGPGMQAAGYATGLDLMEGRLQWLVAKDDAVRNAVALEPKFHKQVVNRLLEPFMWTRGIITSTDWKNFFVQRDHEKAEPHFRDLAVAMREAMAASVPATEHFHLPLVTEAELGVYSFKTLGRVSAARCARVSYYDLPDEAQTVDKAMSRYDRLVEGRPPDLGPFEHPCLAAVSPGRYRNFRDWMQQRIEVERVLNWNTVEQ